MNNRIGVIGIGRLGLSFALLAAYKEYDVLGYDINSLLIARISEGKHTTSEPLIEEYLYRDSPFSVTDSMSRVVGHADVLFCFVATPSLPDGSYDHSAIDRVVADLQELHVKGQDMSNKILVIGCTTMPGYCDTVQSRLESIGISVAYNPEFIAQGDIINGLRTADMILIGTDDDSTFHALQGIYRTIMTREPKFNRMSRIAAEITKISINYYLATKIAYANTIGEIAINSGIESEISTILTAIGDDSRIGNKYLSYGFGYGGPCIPRDGRALSQQAMSVGIMSPQLLSADSSNQIHADYLLQFFIRQNLDKSVPFLFTQLTYKAGTDILTESQQYRLCRDILAAGYSVDITESSAVIAQVQQDLAEYADRITYGGLITGCKIDI